MGRGATAADADAKLAAAGQAGAERLMEATAKFPATRREWEAHTKDVEGQLEILHRNGKELAEENEKTARENKKLRKENGKLRSQNDSLKAALDQDGDGDKGGGKGSGGRRGDGDEPEQPPGTDGAR